MPWRANRTNYETGWVAEACAAWFLRLKCYRILARRYKTPYGEIDLIAARGSAVHFIEVKARPGLAQGLCAITPHQRRRIQNSAEVFLSRLPPGRFKRVYFGAIILYNGFRIQHLVSAWRKGDS